MKDKNDLNCGSNSITLHISEGKVIIGIAGDFDSSTTPLIHNCCNKIRKSGMDSIIIIDLKRAGRVDTTAFACIISFIKENIGTDKQIFLANIQNREKDFLKLLNVDKMIKILDEK